MTSPAQPELMLTFAEIAFLLHPYPALAQRVRRELGIKDEAATDVVRSAGASSLLARGLCRVEGDRAVPTEPVVLIAAALATADTFAEAVTFTATRPVVLNVVGGPVVRLGLIPAAFGLFTVVQLDAAKPLSQTVMELLDRCDPGTQAALAVRMRSPRGEVAVALARDTAGAWFISDTLASPGQGRPTTREAGVARLGELLGTGAR